MSQAVRQPPAPAVDGAPVAWRARASARARALTAWVVERRVVLLVGLLAALPVVVAVVRALTWHWFPVSIDNGVIGARSVDVFSDRSPLVGQYSQVSHLTGHATYSPGPLLYWLLAIPARIGPSAMVVTIGLLNVASVMGAVALARRRGGQALMFATAIAIAVMCHSLGTERLHDIWNPYAAVMPLLLLIFLCWSIACGEHRLLPLAVLIASFVAQAQVAFVFPAAGLVIVALAGVLLSRRRGGADRLSLRRSLAAAFLIAVVCWSAPLYDQAIHRPGNFAAIVQAGTGNHSTLGAATGWRAVVRTVGIPPWWLRDPPTPLQRLSDVSTVSTFQALTAAAVVGALLAIAIAGVRRRRVDITAAAAMGLVLLAAVAIVAATTPTRTELKAAITWTLWWSAPVGMWIYLSIAWAAASLARRVRRPVVLERPALRRKAARPRAPAIAAVAALIAGATYAIASQQPDELRPLYDPARTIVDRVTASLPAGGSVSVGASPSFIAADFQAGLIYALRRDGWKVATGKFLAPGLVSPYLERPPYDHSVGVHDGEPAPPAERVVTRVLVAPTGAKPRIVAVGLSRRRVR